MAHQHVGFLRARGGRKALRVSRIQPLFAGVRRIRAPARPAMSACIPVQAVGFDGHLRQGLVQPAAVCRARNMVLATMAFGVGQRPRRAA